MENEEVVAKKIADVFDRLSKLNVNEHTDKREGKNKVQLTYLSWAWAWTETLKIYPLATYTIEKFKDNLPYVYDENTGYMVFTTVTIEGLTKEMWLPVMDNNNNAMKSVEYQVVTKYGTTPVKPATMFDVNKTIMRCLVKNLGMFGLGLYIYAGEDLPESDDKPEVPNKLAKHNPSLAEISKKLDEKYQDTNETVFTSKVETPKPDDGVPFAEGDNRISKAKLDYITGIVRSLSVDRVMKFNEWLEKTYKCRSVNELTDSQATSVIAQLTKKQG